MNTPLAPFRIRDLRRHTLRAGASLAVFAWCIALVVVGGPPVAAVVTASCTPAPSSTVGWWPGDGTTADIAGGLDGTLQGDATYGTGEVGQAFTLDGDGDQVTAPDSDRWAFGASDFTVDLWANFHSLPTSFRVRPGDPLVSNDEASSDFNKWFFALANEPEGGPLFFHINDGTPHFIGNNTFTPALNTWYHLAVTRTGGQNYTFYVNGSVIDTETDATSVPNASAPLRLGWAEDSSGYVDGQLDEVEILHTALTAPQVQALYDAGPLGKCKQIMHVARIKPAYRTSTGGYKVRAQIGIRDDGGLAVGGAKVRVRIELPDGSFMWRAGFTSTAPAIEGLTTVVVESAQEGTYEFCVQKVKKAGFSYLSVQDSPHCADIQVPTPTPT